MMMVQVQNKPAQVSRAASEMRLSRLASLTIGSGTTEKDNSAAVESMLLGTVLRGWLADREKQLLDSLAPNRSITFLIRGRQYLHPEGTQLFPSDLIEAGIRQGGEAFFSHRYRPENCQTDGYTIHTALINPLEPVPLVLGYFGPDSQLGRPEIKDRFYRLVSQFRHTYRSAVDIVRDLTGTQKTQAPTIIVNRCSGRVMWTAKAAERLFRTSQQSLVDQEFGQLTSRLALVSCGHKMKMVNISKGSLHLTVITILCTEPQSDGRDDRQALRDANGIGPYS